MMASLGPRLSAPVDTARAVSWYSRVVLRVAMDQIGTGAGLCYPLGPVYPDAVP